MEISKFVRFHGYLSSVSLRLLMVYPNTRLSWFTRQLDLEMMFTRTISLRTANWIKWEKLFTDLVALSTGSTDSLDLFIRFGNLIYLIWWLSLLALFSGFIYSMAVFILLDGSLYWVYLLNLFYGFTYSFALYIRFGGFIYLPYLWTLVSAYTVFMLIANLVSFSHISERNTNTFLSIYTSHVFMEKIFRSTLRHHSCLIKLPLLQLHHHTLLIKLTYVGSLRNIPYTCPLIKLATITSLRHNCHTCSISNLHGSNIIPHCSGSTHLIAPEFQLVQLKFTFILFSQTFASYSIFNYIWNTSKLLLLSGDVEINPGTRPIDQNPVFCTICSRKINRRPQQDMAPTCSNENCSARCHQACNGLSIAQTRHTKDSGCSINWKCPQHGSGIAEAIIPPIPVYEQPSCSVCMNPICTRYADLAYHCAGPSCDNVYHLAATCSGFVYPRGNARPRALSTRIWHCHLHSQLHQRLHHQ